MRKLALLFALLFTTAAFAQQTIDSFSPSIGHASGGTAVTITGTGFTPSTEVWFGVVKSPLVQFVDATRLIAVTPPHFPEPTHIRVGQTYSAATFLFVGVPEDAGYARVLVPILTPPTPGANGSEFRTELRLKATGGRFSTYGLETFYPCPILCIGMSDPLLFEPGDPVLLPENVEYNGTPGRFLFVRRVELPNMSANLRVLDTSRASLNFGTEIPVVDDSKFHDRILLLGVPLDARFRNTLRVYSTRPITVRVTVAGHEPVDVHVAPGTNAYAPAYGTFTDFPNGTIPVRVTIEHAPSVLPVVPPPFWAFISVTNNETQMITTITPQP
jgi:hypothetical protein